MQKHSILIAGHATSLSLEPEFWDALKAIAAEKHMSLAALLTELDKESNMAEEAHTNDHTPNFSSFLRVFVLRTIQAKVTVNQKTVPAES